ncbi:hypothetical protein [Nocardioides taihuensis]|uniref:Uncharacterized protein n=1 Tax=Nocardioides taihuensis TaxID=1835606 RepID=A0ABW0BL09_9ACTN
MLGAIAQPSSKRPLLESLESLGERQARPLGQGVVVLVEPVAERVPEVLAEVHADTAPDVAAY